MEEFLYTKFSTKLKEKYGSKVYKLPLSIDTTCPVRDGTLSKEGCVFCGEKGAGYENHSHFTPIKEQIESNKSFFKKNYGAKKFIAYFQNYTNTYLPIDVFKKYVYEVVYNMEDIVAISFSTRPDCVSLNQLEFLKQIKEEYNLDIIIELGLQSVNNNTLEILNRCHYLSDYLKTALMIKEFDFSLCTHIIISLPWDNKRDIIEAAKIISLVKSDSVKLHTLYIEKNTKLEKMYNNNEFEMISIEECIDRLILFLENLGQDIAIERLISRVPNENIVFLNWNRSHWVIIDLLEKEMKKRGSHQGKSFDRLFN